MKKSFVFVALLLASVFNLANAQIKFPAPSPTQTIKQDFGVGNIELTYSRPSAKGRRVFGDLVPLGKLWRTGANAATKITFSTAVEIGDKKIDTGAYVLYTIPNADNWEIILNKGLKNWGVDGYNASEDIVRFRVPTTKMSAPVENLTMQFANIKPESCSLQIMWENTAISIAITTHVVEVLKAQLEAALLTDKKPYWQAAQFYNEYDKNLPKALQYITKATEENPKAFWMFLYKARIQKATGDKAGALQSSNISLALSKEAKNNDYVKMNEDLQKELKQ